MRRRKVTIRRQRAFPGAALFLGGFLLGSILPNIAWRMEWRQKTIASFYLLGAFADKKVSGAEYFSEVLQIRGSYFLICILCGYSIFGVPLALVGTLAMGLELGILLTMPILQFGLAGGAIGMGLLLPQYILYIPVTLYMMAAVYEQSLDIWRNHGIFPRKISGYILSSGICLVAYLTGIGLETWLNPVLVERLFGLLKLF